MTRKTRLLLGAGAMLLGSLAWHEVSAPRRTPEHIVRSTAPLSPRMSRWLRKDMGWDRYCIDIHKLGRVQYDATVRLCRSSTPIEEYPLANPYAKGTIRDADERLNELQRTQQEVPVAYALRIDDSARGCWTRYTEVYSPFRAADEICQTIEDLIDGYERKNAR